jgi:hypothetical protein
MSKNDLNEIFNALKEHHDKKLILYKKIAGISLISREYLCCNTFMTLLDDVVSIFKGITIDNVASLNVYENPSFCSTLYVIENSLSTPWLRLKLSSIKNSGLGVFFVTKFQGGRIHYCLSW